MSPSKRLISLDVFRGITIAAMLLVNNPGSWSTVYPPLLHAKWHGCTPTDLIFPFFLFIVGISIVLAYHKRLESGVGTGKLVSKSITRAIKIFLLGLLLHGFPYFDLATLRIPGVLQRIAIVYLICSLLFIKTNWKTQTTVGLILLLGYWALMTLVPVPGHGPANLAPETNLGAWLDRLLLEGHLWSQSKVWDPEGLLSTLPAIGTGICGLLAGHLLVSKLAISHQLKLMIIFGCSGVLLGLIWDIYFPINKALWTSSYVIYTAGYGMLFLAIIYWLLDVKGFKTGTRPFIIYGKNAITIYVLSGLLAKTIYLIKITDQNGDSQSFGSWLYHHFYLTWLSDYNASLAFAVTHVLLLLLVGWVMYRKNIFLKI